MYFIELQSEEMDQRTIIENEDAMPASHPREDSAPSGLAGIQEPGDDPEYEQGNTDEKERTPRCPKIL